MQIQPFAIWHQTQRLSELLEIAFHDDIRNGITHADYVIWNDGLRLRKRNGGFADCITFEDVSMVLGKGIGFFELLGEYLSESVKSFSPPKTIVGRFSANPPMTWTVTYDPETGSFEIGDSSPGPQTTPDYLRQEAINKHLGGKVSSIYFVEHTEGVRVVCNHIADRGFKPHEIRMADQQLEELVVSINKENLWQVGASPKDEADMLLLTPKGYRWLREVADFDHYLGKPVLST